jgi:hypothetical protein
MEAIHSSETSVHTRCTRRHIPEDDILHFICLSSSDGQQAKYLRYPTQETQHATPNHPGLVDISFLLPRNRQLYVSGSGIPCLFRLPTRLGHVTLIPYSIKPGGNGSSLSSAFVLTEILNLTCRSTLVFDRRIRFVCCPRTTEFF